VEILSPGVGLVTGEAASGDGIVGHDLAVSDAVGIGVVLRVEEDQGLGRADLEPGISELVAKCAGQMRVGEPCPPCIKEPAHPLGIVGRFEMAEAMQRELGVGVGGGGDLLMGLPPLVTK
jgi:hypothetical protein